MELRHLRSFLALAKHHNFSRAAESVELSQPALSQQIKQLEEELGVELVIRDPMGAQLTPAGEEFRGYASRLLGDLEEAKQAIRSPGLARAETLGVGYSSPFRHAVIEAAGRLIARMPDLSVRLEELSVARIERRLRDGRLHLGVVVDWKSKPGITGHKFAQVPLRLLVHPRDRLATTKPRPEQASLEMVSAARFVLPRRGTRARRAIDSYFAVQNFQPKVAVETSDISTAVAMVAELQGLVSVLPLPGPENLGMRDVAIFPLPQSLPPEASYVIFRGQQLRSEAALRFHELLSDELSNLIDLRVLAGVPRLDDPVPGTGERSGIDDTTKR